MCSLFFSLPTPQVMIHEEVRMFVSQTPCKALERHSLTIIVAELLSTEQDFGIVFCLVLFSVVVLRFPNIILELL